MRERIADLTKQLDEERARTAKLIDAVRDLAMGVPVSPWPIPVPLPHPQPDPDRRLPGVLMAYAVIFPGSATAQQTATAITVTSTPPKGNEQ